MTCILLSTLYLRQPASGIECTENCDAIYKETFDLQNHLTKFDVPDRVYTLLETDGIHIGDLISWRVKDIDNWCDENSLKTKERTRFITAIKNLPNAQAAKPKPTIMLYLEKEHKQQIQQFEQMEQNINILIERIDDINKQENVNTKNITQWINDVCNEMEALVKQLKTDLLSKVCYIAD